MNQLSDPMRARVSLKYQDKLADFELLTTGIELEADAFADRGEKAAELIDRLYDMVSTKLVEKVKDAQQKLNT